MTATVKWWWLRANAQRLINWTHYRLQGRRYTVELVERGTGAQYPKLKKIEANPWLQVRVLCGSLPDYTKSPLRQAGLLIQL